MRLTLFTIVLVFFSLPLQAQTPDYRVLHLVSKLLEKLPDAGYTRQALGTTEERESRANEHAVAIVAAADAYSDDWDDIVEKGNWTEFDTMYDLPALIAGLAEHESSFRSVIRLDDNTLLNKVPRNLARSDLGVMQVRAPSAVAKNCGVSGKAEIRQLIEDVGFAYNVGTCILTKRISAYAMRYRSQAFRRLHRLERARLDLSFYGLIGKRRNTPESRLARDLLVIERYNWGAKDLYLHPIHGGYARRVLRSFEFFRIPKPGDST